MLAISNCCDRQSFQPTYSPTTNQITSIGNCSASYDSNGNVKGDCLNAYTWDSNARPVTINGLGITYDALGRMVERNNAGYITQVVYAPTGNKLAIMTGQTLVWGYVPLPGGTMAQYASGGTVYYRHSDWQGSARLVSTSTRTVYGDVAYGPFGEQYVQSGSTDVMFTGMNQDTYGNIYDFPAREYGIQGRWPSPDPAGLQAANPMDPQTWNRYAYVRNSPLALTDPTGLDSTCRGQKAGKTPCLGQTGGSAGWDAYSPDPFELMLIPVVMQTYGWIPLSSSPSEGGTILLQNGNITVAMGAAERWGPVDVQVGNGLELMPGAAGTDSSGWVTAGTDVAGVASAFSKNLPLGIGSAVISMENDPSPFNVGLNLVSLTPETWVPELGPAATFFGVDLDLIMLEYQIVVPAMIQAIPANTMTFDNGTTIAAPPNSDFCMATGDQGCGIP